MSGISLYDYGAKINKMASEANTELNKSENEKRIEKRKESDKIVKKQKDIIESQKGDVKSSSGLIIAGIAALGITSFLILKRKDK